MDDQKACHLAGLLIHRAFRITAAGEILGEKTRPLGEMDYRYPFVLSKQIHLWDYYYPYPYYYYDPWWGGYPYWWRFTFYYDRPY